MEVDLVVDMLRALRLAMLVDPLFTIRGPVRDDSPDTDRAVVVALVVVASRTVSLVIVDDALLTISPPFKDESPSALKVPARAVLLVTLRLFPRSTLPDVSITPLVVVACPTPRPPVM